jgi:hypothetical protein
VQHIRLASAGILVAGLASSPAWALNPPAVPQSVFDWNYVFDMNTPDPADDGATGFGVQPTGAMAISANCSDFVQPPNQPKAPEGCGVFTPDPGDPANPGYWLFYDGDTADAPAGGWNVNNRWWRNRLILRVANNQITYLGKPVASPTTASCTDPTPCPTGALKFCGTLQAVDGSGSQWSGGTFSACIAPQ